MSDLKRSFPPMVTGTTRLLVLGSLPGERSLAERRYYAHPQNQFWRLIGAVVGRDLASLGYADRLDLLRVAHIGLWDVVATARRIGSGDAAIRDHAANDLVDLVARLPDLRGIAFNGRTSFAIGTRSLGSAAPQVARIALPSSSPLHTIGIAAKQPEWMALRSYLD